LRHYGILGAPRGSPAISPWQIAISVSSYYLGVQELMRAMVLERPGEPLRLMDIPVPQAGPGQVLLRVHACGVCRTDLHVVDGELREPKLPLVPGHQIVGEVVCVGQGVSGIAPGARVGVPWLGGSCGVCSYCAGGQENLCDAPRFTGYQIDGGFAEYCVADARFCFPIPQGYADLQAAPLLCAGLIGYRALRMAGEARRLGLYGFGAAAHIVIQLARWQGREVYALTSPGDTAAQQFALGLGAAWAGGSDGPPPQQLDVAIIFAPVGALVPLALRAVRKGGVVVCAGIHMSDIPSFPYADLWGERMLRSVANLTRHDGEEFLALAPQVPVLTEAHPYPLERANEALEDLRAGRFTGAAVIVV
jgi:alcohol dehydrogenase, propanol-preferring